MLPVSVDCLILIVPSVFSNVYLSCVLNVTSVRGLSNVTSVRGLSNLDYSFGFL